ncbi:uncharacterized protein FSUBG_12014 [Fusarium subglutinans]|uniref:Uncharacterized protein n=1 Tax=Gibberella subglutinans TaxID=42677 RepID=A0A8H5L910_GIBSU|nr:uncharacterized protein FSUBG_12014 [Fusarium subglutinans]KAF5586803.1 hypothetical protein FSUBG_12014 [Fusarium subglutinans]
MSSNRSFLAFPSELRSQIYRDYFHVDGGYVYDAKSDKLKTSDDQPIDLALIFTCRTIANETKHLPLSLNSVTFLTLYREDWRSLAGCFNVVATYYQHLELDFALHVAEFMTPDMQSQLASKYPDFAREFATASANHREHYPIRHDNDTNDQVAGGEASSQGSDPGFENAESQPVYESRGAHCVHIRHILKNWVNPNESYAGFARIHQRYRPGHPSKICSATSCEIKDPLSYCLQLMAEQRPVEFANHIRLTFPQWTAADPVQQFLDLRYDDWAIPSESQLKRVIRLLGLGDIWRRPAMWHAKPRDDADYIDDLDSDEEQDDADNDEEITTSPGHDSDSLVRAPQGIRCREKIRFSAAASAIRFLKRIPNHRTLMKKIVLHEDFKSVKNPETHAQGLVPFLQENSSLQIVRRVSMLDCIFGIGEAPAAVSTYLHRGRERQQKLHKRLFCLRILPWLKEAIAMEERQIPAESFTLVLEAGGNQDYCTDLFQRILHRDVAWCRAQEILVARGTLSLSPSHIYHDRICVQDLEAIDRLVNHTSTILTTDFNTGVAWDVQALIQQIQHLNGPQWTITWIMDDGAGYERMVLNQTYRDRVAEVFEIQTDDGHLVASSDTT